AAHRPGILQRQYRRLVAGSGRDARSGSAVLDIQYPAADCLKNPAPGWLQRHCRYALAVRNFELQPGAHLRPERPGIAIQRDTGAEYSAFGYRLARRRNRWYQCSISQLPQPAGAHGEPGAAAVPAVLDNLHGPAERG